MSSKIAFLVSLVPVILNADTLWLQASDTSGKSAFLGTGASWKSASGTVHKTPLPGNDYVIDGSVLSPAKNNLEPRSNSAGGTTFAGDALYLRDRDIALLSPNAAPFVCTNLIADGANGAVMSAAANQRLEGRVTVPTGGAIAFWLVSDNLAVASDLYGEGRVDLRGQTKKAGFKLCLYGDNSHFAGRFATTGLSGQKLVFETASSWFGNPVSFDADSVCLTNDVPVYFNASFAAHTPNRGIDATPGEGLSLTYFAVAEDRTVSLDSPIRSPSGIGKGQAGTLILCGPSPDLAGRIPVEAGTLGFGVSNAFGSAALEMSAGTTLRYCSTNGPLVLASAPNGSYCIEIPATLGTTTDLLSLPENASFDLLKVSLKPEAGGGVLCVRTENGRKIVYVYFPEVPEEAKRTFYLAGNDSGLRMSSFDGTGAGWTNVLGRIHMTPQPGYVYVVDGYEPKTRETGHTVFLGDELRLVSKDIALKGVNADVGGIAYEHFICSNLVVTGTASILNGCPLVETIEGKITVEQDAELAFYNLAGSYRSIRVFSDLQGAGTVVVKNVDDGSYVSFSGDNASFTGRVTVANSSNRQIVRFQSPTAWFGNPAAFDADAVLWERGMRIYFDCSIETHAPNRGLDITPGGSHPQASIAVTNDARVTFDMPVRSDRGFGKWWPGTLVLGADSPELCGTVSVGEGMLGVGSTNALGQATLAMGEGTTLLFSSTNGPLCLASAPTGTYAIGLDIDDYPEGVFSVEREVLRLPPDAAFDASRVTLAPFAPEKTASSKLIVRRSSEGLVVSVRYRRRSGLIFGVR